MTKWTFATIALVTTALAALIVWLRYDFDPTTAAVALLALFGVVVFAAGAMLSLASQRATLNAIGDFQRNDDRGEVERMKALRMALGYDKTHTPKTPEPYFVDTPQLPQPARLQIPMRQDAPADGVYYE